MIPTRGAVVLAGLLSGCYIEQDVLVTVAQSDVSDLEPSLRYAYYREDPVNQRIHIRFTDYWNPCIADAQLQNQFRSNPAAADQAAAYASLMPRQAWSADVYLNVDSWPRGSQTNLQFDVVPQRSEEDDSANFDLVCLLRQCPYEARCETCLPDRTGALAGFSRTYDHLDASYFQSNTSEDRVPQYASSGVVDVAVWNPAIRSEQLDYSGAPFADAQLDRDGAISGTVDVDLREFGQSDDSGSVQLQFTARLCEPMQASYTDDLARFQRRDLNTYGPSGCRVAPTPGGPWGIYGLGLLALALGRRSRPSSGTKAATR